MLAHEAPFDQAIVDLATGQFHAADVPWPRLPDELARLAPAECLCAENDPARLHDAPEGSGLSQGVFRIDVRAGKMRVQPLQLQTPASGDVFHETQRVRRLPP